MSSLAPYKRLGIVHVIGSWTLPHNPLAFELGQAIALNGFCLMTGGNGGVAKSCAEGFKSIEGRKGVTIGVLAKGMEGEEDGGFGEGGM
jgi:predicted Rossmann-fold nucleotide-binding protein